ncbi:MAG: hypothetical protein JWN17_2512 [Frankiales bacterium]|nr:hypothetical protein [Frankiales bacterium]
MPRVPSALHALEAALASRLRELTAAVVVVLLLGAGAAMAGSGPAPAPAPVQATSERIDVVALPTASPSAVPAASPSAVARPSSSPSPRPVRRARVVARWLPTGTGMWLHEWSQSERGHAPQVVAEARAAGLTHLYVQTGSSRKGWIGTPVLSQLLPATRGTGLEVVAWDFPTLVHPEADARRLARAASFRRPGAPRVAAVAPDVETGSEGTRLSAAALETYYRTLRAALPDDVAVIATVPWPSEHRVNTYPYARTSRHADAIAPMAYWYNRSPSVVTSTSIAFLHKYGKPVLPVGQGYDGRLDAPYLAADPAPDRSVQAFVDAARRGGSQAVSLWSWQTTGDLQWKVLADAAGFPSGVQATPVPQQPAPDAPAPAPASAAVPSPEVVPEPVPALPPSPVASPSAPAAP